MRPGRLDRILYVGPPDQKAREEILKIRTRTMSVEPGLDVAEIARIVSIFVSSLVRMSAGRSDVRIYRRKDARARRSLPFAKRQRC